MGVEQDLLDAIAREPEDPAPYLVYADWLQSREALRGELMTLQNATHDRPGDHRISDAALDHVRAHAGEYLGGLAQLVDEPEFLQLGWRCGFIASAELTWNRPWRGQPPPEVRPREVLETLLRLESARFLTRLVVEPTREVDARFIGDALAEHAPATLREVWIGPRDPLSTLRDCTLGKLAFWARVPHLRELVIHGDPSSLGTLELPGLRSATIMFHRYGGGLREVLFEISAARWPCIERLQLWDPNSPSALAACLARTDLVVLGDLGVINCDFADPACRMVATSPLVPQLFRLSFAKGALTDAGVQILVEHAAAFVNLSMIDVSETFVTAAGVARLRTLAPEVVARDLRTGAPRIAVPPLVRTYDE